MEWDIEYIAECIVNQRPDEPEECYEVNGDGFTADAEYSTEYRGRAESFDDDFEVVRCCEWERLKLLRLWDSRTCESAPNNVIKKVNNYLNRYYND